MVLGELFDLGMRRHQTVRHRHIRQVQVAQTFPDQVFSQLIHRFPPFSLLLPGQLGCQSLEIFRSRIRKVFPFPVVVVRQVPFVDAFIAVIEGVV